MAGPRAESDLPCLRCLPCTQFGVQSLSQTHTPTHDDRRLAHISWAKSDSSDSHTP